MVDGISSRAMYTPSFGNANAGFYKGLTGAAVANQGEIGSLTRFLLGAPQTEHEETLTSSLAGTVPFLGIFGTLQAFPWLKDNYKHPITTIKADKAAYLANPKNSRYNIIENGKNVLVEQKDKLFKGLTETEKAALQTDRKFLGKTLDHIPGYKKLRATGFGQMMGKSGAGWMIAIDGGIKLFTEIVPTFKELGAGAGMKQVAKSATSVVAGAAGWTAGEIAGSAVGAAIGTAICPGIGTVVGKFVGGFLGGTTGMYFATKGTKAITGKSEIELNKDKQVEQVAQEAQANPETKLALATQAAQQAQTILEKDPENKEALEALATALKILSENTIDTKADEAEAEYNGVQEELAATPDFGNLTAGLHVPPVPGFNGLSYDMNAYTQAMSNASMPNFKTMNNYGTNPYGMNNYNTTPYNLNPTAAPIA